MIYALASGQLVTEPSSGLTKAGKPYARAMLRSGDGEEAIFVSLLVFGDDGVEELLAARKGDGLAASGRLQVGEYLRNGERTPSYTLLGARVLTAGQPKRRKAVPANEADDFFGQEAGSLDDVAALRTR